MEDKSRMVGYASLIWGGALVITYVAFAYSAIWRQEFLPVFPEGTNRMRLLENVTDRFAQSRNNMLRDPLSLLMSPQALAILLTGCFLLFNGYYLLRILNKKEARETKKTIISSMLTPDEKVVYDLLAKTGGQATQKQLSMQTGFSAVRIYRTIKRLEEKQIVKTFPFGMTKKIVLREG